MGEGSTEGDSEAKVRCATCSPPEDAKKKKYATAEEAAAAAMKEHNPQSMRDDREYAGFIVKNPDGTYSPSGLFMGEPGAGSVALPGAGSPGGPPENAVGWWHTHGRDSTLMPGAYNVFSAGDETVSSRFGLPGYVAVPSGEMIRYDPVTDTRTTLPGSAL